MLSSVVGLRHDPHHGDADVLDLASRVRHGRRGLALIHRNGADEAVAGDPDDVAVADRLAVVGEPLAGGTR
jgi:hypothetical protein